MKKYKRKFRVQGRSLIRCRDYRKECEKRFGNKPPCLSNVKSFIIRPYFFRDENLCPFPINKPREYIVSETLEGKWECSCPAWKFRRKQCHHIKEAKKNPKKYEISVEFTEKTSKVFEKIFEG